MVTILKLLVRITKYPMCLYIDVQLQGHLYIFIPNINFLTPPPFTDDNDSNDNDDA